MQKFLHARVNRRFKGLIIESSRSTDRVTL